ncbi:MAG: hypothetical protein ACI92G_002167 [Candidatus Pelagisphaera sp.]|jgi:hypothetical protein
MSTLTGPLETTADETSASGEFEFEREPVAPNALKGASKFWGMYAGEHAAGTEFMIGPLFLLAGVTLQNVFLRSNQSPFCSSRSIIGRGADPSKTRMSPQRGDLQKEALQIRDRAFSTY